MKFSKTALSIVFLSVFLQGCSTLSSPDSKCMKTVLVSTLSKAPLSPVFEEDHRFVTISAFKAGCRGSTPELPGGKGDIGINMTLTMPESKQKHGKVRKVTVPVFIALMDKEDNILDRQDEKVEVNLSDHCLNHTHKMIYHPPQDIAVDSEAHHIFVGFNGSIIPVSVKVHIKKTPLVKNIRKNLKKKPKLKKLRFKKNKATPLNDLKKLK